MWEIYDKEFVDFETAKKLKKAGFKDKTITCYTKESTLLFGHYKDHNNSQNYISAPSWCKAAEFLQLRNELKELKKQIKQKLYETQY